MRRLSFWCFLVSVASVRDEFGDETSKGLQSAAEQCQDVNVRRRRRVPSCSCRRRSTDADLQAGWTCKDRSVVQTESVLDHVQKRPGEFCERHLTLQECEQLAAQLNQSWLGYTGPSVYASGCLEWGGLGIEFKAPSTKSLACPEDAVCHCANNTLQFGYLSKVIVENRSAVIQHDLRPQRNEVGIIFRLDHSRQIVHVSKVSETRSHFTEKPEIMVGAPVLWSQLPGKVGVVIGLVFHGNTASVSFPSGCEVVHSRLNGRNCSQEAQLHTELSMDDLTAAPMGGGGFFIGESVMKTTTKMAFNFVGNGTCLASTEKAAVEKLFEDQTKSIFRSCEDECEETAWCMAFDVAYGSNTSCRLHSEVVSETVPANGTQCWSKSPQGGFVRSAKGLYCDNAGAEGPKGYLKEFQVQSQTEAEFAIARDECEEFCLISDVCWGCSVNCGEDSSGNPICQWNAVQICGEKIKWTGRIEGDISMKTSSSGEKFGVEGATEVRRYLGAPVGAVGVFKELQGDMVKVQFAQMSSLPRDFITPAFESCQGFAIGEQVRWTGQPTYGDGVVVGCWGPSVAAQFEQGQYSFNPSELESVSAAR